MPIDGNPNDLQDTAISIHFVTERLRACKAKNIVLVLDMCRNEHHEVGQKSAVSVADALKKLVQDREGQQGIITLFSCGRGESSYEIASLKQGAFTHALLEGLKQQTILKELARYLERRVPELHRESGKTRKQVPLLIPEPDWKCDEPILSHYVTAVNVARLKEMAIDDVPLESEKGVDYRKLRDLLKAEKWEEADKETLQVMLKATSRESESWLDEKSLRNFPCKDLKINRSALDTGQQWALWLQCSEQDLGKMRSPKLLQ